MKTFSITKQIIIKASPEKVFATLTSSDEIPKYYPLNEVISSWQVGDSVHYKGEISGQAFTDYGVITELKHPEVYSYRYWSDNHGTENIPDNHLTINYTLLLVNGTTQLTLVQDNIKSEEMFNVMNTVVWDMLLNGLKEYLESGL